MARPRTFDEEAAVEAATKLFARSGFDAVSIDDLVGELGVHRHSLYRTFGSKRGLYLRALRRARAKNVHALAVAEEPLEVLRTTVLSEQIIDLDLLLMAAIEQAAVDPEVSAEVRGAFAELDAAASASGGALPATMLLGLRLRARAGDPVSEIVDQWCRRSESSR
ncbi:TetR/AcrR family transcriptional regulator [Nocardia rhizosphaerihabitans]|uniref:HTH tetR-type domain-containing protein n=1 Tax=Nocardia rhizosphaerihabitans TaxID=1691570 RepID=A0ABQ2KA72_9NOCA|nr:helix-turn-helix domain-containing protein [Nocardia rhizosphaerihabitans]GGN74755.1 hypothetical protein GCM10011610_18550 [Nocardia rhizosphaerihabitans]